MSKNLYLIETVSSFRMAYCIRANSQEEAENILLKSVEPKEFGQEYIGENTFNITEVNTEQYISMFNDMNDYIAHIDHDRKLSYIMEDNNEG